MEFIKKFIKEISVFGLVFVVFLGLFAYRQITFKDYTTINQTELTEKMTNKDDFVVVIGNSTESKVLGYQTIMEQYTTKNRSTPFYYLDSANVKDIDAYVEKTFQKSTTYPVTIVVNDGQVTATKEGSLTYYSLYDFVQTNLK